MQPADWRPLVRFNSMYEMVMLIKHLPDEDALNALDAWYLERILEQKDNVERSDRRIAENEERLAAFLGRRGFTDDDMA